MKKSKKIHDGYDKEIDLIELFKTVWEGRKLIIRFILFFGLVGLFIAVFSAKEYTASTIVVPESSNDKVGGSLGGLAAMAGINLGRAKTENISPDLYSKIVQSVPFRKEVLKTKLKFSNLKEKITYKEYYKEHKSNNILSVIKDYTIGLPSKVAGLFKKEEKSITIIDSDSIYRVSVSENKLFKQLEKQLIVEYSKKNGFVKISFSMPEALASAQMTKKVQELLQRTIIEFKTQKNKEEFVFVEERYNELKKDFEKKQAVLASFRDRNKGLVTSRSQSRIESLQSEYNLAFSLYSEMAKQFEGQKIKLKENTPIFTIIEPASVPVEKSKPKRVLILVVWLFLGFVLGIGFVLGKEWTYYLKNSYLL